MEGSHPQGLRTQAKTEDSYLQGLPSEGPHLETYMKPGEAQPCLAAVADDLLLRGGPRLAEAQLAGRVGISILALPCQPPSPGAYPYAGMKDDSFTVGTKPF